MTAVSNTTPLHYLVLIGYVDVLAELFESVAIPEAVLAELRHGHAPETVQAWIEEPPPWLRVKAVVPAADAQLARLDPGEREAILLAEQHGGTLVLLDERTARAVASERGLRVAGTLGVLDAAAERGLVDLHAAVERLRQTNARLAPTLLKQVLERQPRR